MFALDPSLLGLVDSVAVVTGGGGPTMGRAHCVELARAGCHIVVADIDEQAGMETVRMVEALGRQAFFVKCDVTGVSAADALVEAAIGAFGRIDVAVNHVGSGLGTAGIKLEDIPIADFERVLAYNLVATAHCCQAQVRHMRGTGFGGCIVNIASIAGASAAPGFSAYGVAKAGIVHLTKSLALEVAADAIRVNCVLPALHPRPSRMADPGYDMFLERNRRANPMGRLGDPVETAGVVVFLASRLSAYVTGTCIPADGGVLLTTRAEHC